MSRLCPDSIAVSKDAESDSSVKIGIMGGTFDPIHLGHLSCAERALDALCLDKVLFIVSGNPAFKQERELASPKDRLEMCKLACADNPVFSVSDMEIDRAGITYTVDTLEELHSRFGSSVELYFIIGSDSLDTLDAWKDASRLAMLAHFVCVIRPGYDPDPSRLAYLRKAGFLIDIIEAPLLDISSSDIRALRAGGHSIRYLTPLSVCRYIERNALYEISSKGQIR